LLAGQFTLFFLTNILSFFVLMLENPVTKIESLCSSIRPGRLLPVISS
jgi:hypothetical protein